MEHTKLEAWKEAVNLTVEVYELTKSFPKDEMYGLTSQLKRAVISVPSNIAEGCARNSTAETIHFLYMALGSLAEAETQIVISNRLGYIDDVSTIAKNILLVKQLVLGLIKY